MKEIKDLDKNQFERLEKESEELLKEDLTEYLKNFGTVEDKYTVNATTQFFVDISKYKVLTAKEEHDLAVKMVNGDVEAREQLFLHNIKLVVSIAKRYNINPSGNSSLELLDHIQNGMFGLFKALDMYNPLLGYKFSTYATWWIRQSILREKMNTENSVRIPVHQLDKYYKYKKMYAEKANQEGRPLTEEELVELRKKVNLGKADIEEVESYYSPVRLNNVVKSADSDTELGELIPDARTNIEDKVLSEQASEDMIQIAKDLLSEKQYYVVNLRLGLETGRTMTLEEVGKLMGITRERVRQIEKKALTNLSRNSKIRAYKRAVNWEEDKEVMYGRR